MPGRQRPGRPEGASLRLQLDPCHVGMQPVPQLLFAKGSLISSLNTQTAEHNRLEANKVAVKSYQYQAANMHHSLEVYEESQSTRSDLERFNIAPMLTKPSVFSWSST